MFSLQHLTITVITYISVQFSSRHSMQQLCLRFHPPLIGGLGAALDLTPAGDCLDYPIVLNEDRSNLFNEKVRQGMYGAMPTITR
jgi:hypothetical protein